MKILITGVSGFIGKRLVGKLSTQNQVFGTYYNRKVVIKGCKTFFLDITKEAGVKRVFEEVNPDIVVHCAAVSQPDGFEDPSKDVNILGTTNVVKHSNESKFIFISSDYIFDGRDGPYSENDFPNPINLYGRSKFEGEKAIKMYRTKNWAIVRTSLVYGWPNRYQRSNFVVDVIRNLRKNQNIHAFTNQYRTPTHLDDLADGICNLIESDTTGIFNIAGNEYLDRYSLALITAKVFELDERLIIPLDSDAKQGPNVTSNKVSKLINDKPSKAGLDITKAKKNLRYSPMSLKKRLEEMKNCL